MSLARDFFPFPEDNIAILLRAATVCIVSIIVLSLCPFVWTLIRPSFRIRRGASRVRCVVAFASTHFSPFPSFPFEFSFTFSSLFFHF